ncbi:MAG: hypothetical protein BroJett021_21740 [Chloroflexota bacterium]|jgi:hypothetical protein|nr:MAG: hypothetical protein BroJett021_21740 [Chloroflexota bacterium]
MTLLKNTYVILGVIMFVFILGMGVWLGFGWRDSLLAAAALTVVGLGLEWLRQTLGWEF